MITITAPTKIDNASITDTTITVTDDIAINVADVTIDPVTSAGYSAFNCVQTNPARVDCTIQVDSS